MRPRPASPPAPAPSPDSTSDYVPDIPFTPVPIRRSRHDGWTPERQRGFIAQLGRIGVVSAAAGAVGMSVKAAYALRKRAGAESFAAAWDRAVEIGRARALDVAIDRALNGTAKPVFYRGRQVGERRVFDHRLIAAAIRTRSHAASGGLTLQQALDALGDTEAPE